MKRFAAAAAMLCVALGCAAQPWQRPARRAAQATYAKRTYALTQSMYFAQMYDDNERFLLSAQPSDEVSHRVSLRGAPLHPPPALGIVPAGTPVVLERIEFPTRWATVHRMLTSPVHHIWLRLRPAPGAMVTLVDPHKPWVVVLDDAVTQPRALHAALAEVLAAPEAVEAWLAGYPPGIRAGIAQKIAVVGMDERAMVAALGRPIAWRSIAGAQGESGKMAVYEKERVTLLNGLVADIASNAATGSPLP